MKNPLAIFLFSVLLLLPLSAAESAAKRQKLSAAEALPLLKSHRGDAIELGSGPVDVYAFIDPRCPHSRDFVDLIYGSEKMRRRYHYYFFLYGHPMFRSGAVINAVYNASDPKKAMLDYMLKRAPLPRLNRLTPPAVHVKVARIARMAERIGVDKRPYLILDKKKQP